MKLHPSLARPVNVGGAPALASVAQAPLPTASTVRAQGTLPAVTAFEGRTGQAGTLTTSAEQRAVLGAQNAARAAMANGRVWDLSVPAGSTPQQAEFLAAVKDRLAAFANGTAGTAARALEVRGRSAEQLHAALLSAGFEHRREPLKGPTIPLQVGMKDGAPEYQRRDGSLTQDPADPDVKLVQSYVRRDGVRVTDPADNIVPHDIYVHPQDGSMVRIKPEGDPSSALRPEPHVSRSVLLAPGGAGGRFSVASDTGWNNEGFKVTVDGHAVPKAPRAEFGLRALSGDHPQLVRFKPASGKGADTVYQDTIMGAAHHNLPAAGTTTGRGP